MTVLTTIGAGANLAGRFINAVLGSRILQYALAAGVLALGFRWWLNHHDDKVWAESREATSLSMKADLEKELKIRIAAKDELIRQARADKATAEARYGVITDMLNQSFRRLDKLTAAVKERQIIYVDQARAVPPSKLDGTIRGLANDLDAIERAPDPGQDHTPGGPPR